MKNNRGITLIALVITVVLMLILAGVVVTDIRDGRLFDYATNAVKSTESVQEKEIVSQAIVIAISKSKTGKINQTNLQNALNSVIGETGKAIIDDSDEEGFIVKFVDTNRYYNVSNDGDLEYIQGASEK